MLKVLVLICTSIVLVSADCPLSDDDCAARNVAIDLTFLIDGSGSISEANFTRVKEWILTAVNRFEPVERLAEDRLQVTVVQYSDRFATELDSQLVQTSSDEIRASVIGINQMKEGTNTYGGLSYVTDRLHPDDAAYKVLITMTDGGENDDRNTTAVEITKGYFDLMAGVGIGKYIDWGDLLNDLTKGVGPFMIDDFITLDNITGNITNAVKPVCVGADTKCSIATDSTVSLDIFICVNGDDDFINIYPSILIYKASITLSGPVVSVITNEITNEIRNDTLELTGLDPITTYTITVAYATAGKNIIHVPSPINCSTKVIKSKCSEEWVKLNSLCYYFSFGQRSNTSWANAQSRCEKMGSNLVTIDDRNEHSSLLTQVDGENMVEIGLNDTEEISMWNWIDGEIPSYMNGSTLGETIVEDDIDDCVLSVERNRYWINGDCSQSRAYVCEMKDIKHICEHTKDEIECYEDKVIFIHYAVYGRLDLSQHCDFNSSGEGCYWYRSSSLVAKLCNGQSNCTLNPLHRFYGDPCVDIVKYMNVVYSCVSPGTCSVKQSILGYTFPPTQPGLTAYSEEKCSNGENTALASILCLMEDKYGAASLKVSECESIDSVISAPFDDTTLGRIDLALTNVSALNGGQVEQVVVFLYNISNLDAQNYSQKQIMEVASIFSHLSEYYNKAEVTAVQRVKERQDLVRSFERISRRLDSGNTASEPVYTPLVNVKVTDISKVNTSYVFNATFYEDKTSKVTSYPMTITIPAGALKQARSLLSTLRVVSVGYRSSVLFPSEKTADWVISSSIGDSTRPLEGIALTEPVIIRSNYILEPTGQKIVDNKKVVTSYECVFWDFNISNWSTEGCSLLSSEPATCQCNHLTNFAILVSRVELPEDKVLGIVTYIGVGLSILGLLLTLLTICLLRGLRKKYQMQILGNICLCLAIALALFVAGVRDQVDIETVPCSILTVFMHFFFLASWMWIAVYSYAIYRDLVQVMTSYGRMFKILYAACFGYGAPVVIVVLNAGITLGHIDRNVTVTRNATLESSYRSREFCWLRHYSLYFGFLLPVALLLLFNVVVYCIVIPKITCKIAQMQSTKSKRSIKQNTVTSICLATTMGLSWVFGYLMLVSDDPTFLNAMSWLFTITNSFQGVMIFYMTVIRTGEYKKLFAPPKTDLSVVSTGLSTTDDKN